MTEEKDRGEPLFADRWFDSYRQYWSARPGLRSVRVRIRRQLWVMRQKVPEQARMAKRKIGKLVPNFMKSILKELFRTIVRIGRGNRRASPARFGGGSLQNTSGRDSENEVILSRTEYRELIDDLKYWREQAGHLLDELEYLKTRHLDR